MNPSLCVFTICWNEAKLMPYFLRHYEKLAAKIIVFDEHSTDGTREMVKACNAAELRDWPYQGLDDEKFRSAVNGWYREALGEFDWVAWPDIDEILWHPNLLALLAMTHADALQATGWAMMSETWPKTDNGQLYDRIRLGLRQPNYDKVLLWRPEINMQHDYGRHTSKDWPKCNGNVLHDPDLRLLHYHFLGLKETEIRHLRNYGRALDKRFAWNYDAKHDPDPKQIGSLAWMKDALARNLLEDVFAVDNATKGKCLSPLLT